MLDASTWRHTLSVSGVLPPIPPPPPQSWGIPPLSVSKPGLGQTAGFLSLRSVGWGNALELGGFRSDCSTSLSGPRWRKLAGLQLVALAAPLTACFTQQE